MDFDYVALEWRTGHPKQDTTFAEERREMLDRGWTEHLRALWPQERMPRRLAGGICIMRRPKDEPRMWTDGELLERNTELQGRISEREETIHGLRARLWDIQAALLAAMEIMHTLTKEASNG